MFYKLVHKTFKKPLDLYVREDIRRKNEKYTILLLHGIAIDGRFWDDLIKKIKDSDKFSKCRIISLDLLGEGKSPAPDWLEYTLDDHLSAIENTLKKRKVKTPLIVVGHSMGGILALNYTLRNRVNKLMMIGSPILPALADRSVLDDFHSLSFKSIGLLATKNQVLGPIVKFMHVLSTRTKYDINSVAFRKTLQHVVLENDAINKMKKVKQPIYLLRGTADIFSDHKNYIKAAKQKNVTLKEAPLIGHQIHGSLLSSVVEQLESMVK